ncbi:MAG: exo-beta-N-acetylmuramidase NamZ domain-containing protein [Bdellovibrionia bacterium]
MNVRFGVRHVTSATLCALLLFTGVHCSISLYASLPVALADEPPLATKPTAQQPISQQVLLGSDRLFEPAYLDALKGKRVGILAHAASRTHDGTHVVDWVASHHEFDLKMIFAPEHGYRSVDDTLLPDSQDPMTGLPVYSLYGPRKAPTDEMLSQLDAVLIDLQDVGLRYYTYPATLVYTLRACQKNGTKVFILDRPNPLGGSVVDGALLDSSLANGSLTTLAAVPTRHGMTLGELAILYNKMLGIGADVTVVPMSGWNRSMLWDDSKLQWVPPSPALTTPEQTYLYALFGTLESANLAVGRGKTNEFAFHIFGAPWITQEKGMILVKELQQLSLPGLQFQYVSWVPNRDIFLGKLCRGFRVDVTNPSKLEGFRSLILVLEKMKSVLGASFDTKGLLAMLGADWLKSGIDAGTPVNELMERASRENQDFMKLRQEALIYP